MSADDYPRLYQIVKTPMITVSTNSYLRNLETSLFLLQHGSQFDTPDSRPGHDSFPKLYTLKWAYLVETRYVSFTNPPISRNTILTALLSQPIGDIGMYRVAPPDINRL